MNPVFYVDNNKLQSHNDSGKNQYKRHHSERFKNRYKKLYSGIPTKENNLQTQLVYISNRYKSPDVDNLSKPIIDAFSGVIYEDDKQVIKREATLLELKDLEVVTIDFTNMPPKIVEDLDDYITEKEEYILLLTVNNVDYKNITIGGIQI